MALIFRVVVQMVVLDVIYVTIKYGKGIALKFLLLFAISFISLDSYAYTFEVYSNFSLGEKIIKKVQGKTLLFEDIGSFTDSEMKSEATIVQVMTFGEISYMSKFFTPKLGHRLIFSTHSPPVRIKGSFKPWLI